MSDQSRHYIVVRSLKYVRRCRNDAGLSVKLKIMTGGGA